MCLFVLLAFAPSAHAQVFRAHGSGTGDYTTTSFEPVWVLGEHILVPIGKLARIDISGSFLWYRVPGGYCDGYVALHIDGQVDSYLGLTSGPTMGTNDKPFHLSGFLPGDGRLHRFQLWFNTRTPGCEVGIENTGTTNLVETVELETQ